MSEFETFDGGKPARFFFAVLGVLTFVSAGPCLYFFWDGYVTGTDDMVGMAGIIGLLLFLAFVGFASLKKAVSDG